MVFAVALAGALGACARYTIERLVTLRTRYPFPLGTFVVNVTGSFALGLLTGLLLYRGLSADAAAVLGTGFLGGYTTFSAFAAQTVGLAASRAPSVAWAYLAASALGPTLAAAIGLAVVRGS